ELRIVDHDEPAVLGLGGQRMLERQRTDLLRQVSGVRTHDRTEGTTAATELRPAGRARTGTARAPLPGHSLSGGPGLRAALRLVGAGLALVELPLHAARDDVGARLQAEDGVRQLHGAGGLALECYDFQFHLTRPPSRPALPQPHRPRP